MMTIEAPVFRPADWASSDYGYMEKRQLFLRSYHFSRKKNGMDRVRGSAVRVRRLIWVRLRRLPRLLWYRLKYACRYGRRRRIFPLSPSCLLSSIAFGSFWSGFQQYTGILCDSHAVLPLDYN